MFGMQCVKLWFRPGPGLRLLETEFAVAVYIFAKKGDRNEVLYPSEHVIANREAFWSLAPKVELWDDIISVVATMLTDDRREPTWWLPTTFAQQALSPVNHDKDTMDYVVTRYIRGYVDDVDRIYVPINKDRHWYLLAFLLQNTLKEKQKFRKYTSMPKNLSDLEVKEPLHGQQQPRSRDCGVWEITDDHRMRLAVDIVMTRANHKQQELCILACNYWHNMIQKDAENYGDASSVSKDDGDEEKGLEENSDGEASVTI
ncbi:hypothetical protein PIB30_090411 [Stylosanthes scabra]|uniref:Ubiquitin-like protease family profile domain-containing protein n=1 Tax=Stylosanthes scabra TaxID=79078 RepID=A0ABU6WXT0_9FABA|nr:hypothetical protein [Stylosanthes scabra]